MAHRNRWCSQLETSIHSGFSMSMLNNQMVRETMGKMEKHPECSQMRKNLVSDIWLLAMIYGLKKVDISFMCTYVYIYIYYAIYDYIWLYGLSMVDNMAKIWLVQLSTSYKWDKLILNTLIPGSQSYGFWGSLNFRRAGISSLQEDLEEVQFLWGLP